MDSQDVLGVARRGVASLDAIKESRANIAEIERKLVAILDAKPFGLPLTAQEKKDLETAKRDIADAEEADKKDKAKADEAEKATPPAAVANDHVNAAGAYSDRIRYCHAACRNKAPIRVPS